MNKWLGMGRLTRDADVRVTTGTEPMTIARFTLAVDRKWAKKDAEQGADFISCIAFGKKAEFVERYVKQGTKVCIEGRIQTGNYTNKEGMKVYTTDVVVEDIEFAESKAKDSQEAPKPAPDNGFIKVPEGLENDLPFK